MDWETTSGHRDRLAKEEGTIIKDWGGRIPVALIYPNTYYVGMSNLGVQAIYEMLNADDGIVCERGFWDGQGLNGSGRPALSVESQRDLGEFAALAFSLTFELDYFNVIAMLRQAQIPVLSSERDQRHPILIAGGPCMMQNPEPLAPILDAIAIGEGEAIVPSLARLLKEGPHDDRPAMLRKLAIIPGVYVPSLYDVAYRPDGTIAGVTARDGAGGRASARPISTEKGGGHLEEENPPLPIVRQYAADLDRRPVHSVVLTPDTELGGMYLVEVSRGCNRGCQFCLAGFVFLPNRERSLETILATAREGLRFRRRIGLVGAATTDYSRIGELARRLRELGADVAISSLRIDSLSDDLLGALVESGTKTITLAPEAGSERMRLLINKRINVEQIDRAVGMLGQRRISRLKLYFMIGLPTETMEDIDEIIRLTLDIKRKLSAYRKGVQITITVSNFVPKAQTPFQREPMMSVAELKARMNRLKHGLSHEGVAVRVDSAEWAEVQGVLARGDRRVAGVMLAMERNSLADWRRALVEQGLATDFYLRRPRPMEEKLPWEFIRSGVRPELKPLAERGKKGFQARQ